MSDPFRPNPVTRFCTSELKIRVMRDFARSVGFDHWTNVLGLRADEMHRVRKARANTKERWENVTPLATAGITEADVLAYWKAQPFDLGLTSGEGNCDLCFLKSAATISAIIARRPDLAVWWAEAEAEAEARASKPSGATFRMDRPSYAKMIEAVRRQDRFDFGDADKLNDCFCHE